MTSEQKQIFAAEVDGLRQMLENGLDNFDSDGLTWLNKVCMQLTKICELLHGILSSEHKWHRNVVDVLFICLRQLICCINHLEKVMVAERSDAVKLKFCRQHFFERIGVCLSRMVKIVNESNESFSNSIGNDSNFVVYMDEALKLLAPLTLYPSYDSTLQETQQNQAANTPKPDFPQSSKQVRETIELLLSHTLAFINVVKDDADRASLKSLCQHVMKECIDFQNACTSEDKSTNTENEKRLRAQQLQNALGNLDKLMNECLLRVFCTIFIDLKNNPIRKLRALQTANREDDKIQEEIENFDDVLDRVIQIGTFAIAYSCDPKVKSHLQSSLASFEALSSYLIPSILSTSTQPDSIILEDDWNQSINCFRRSALEIINSHAFCLALIDRFDEPSLISSNIETDTLKELLLLCEIFNEHVQINSAELNLMSDESLRLFYEDFKMMLNECIASIKTLQNSDTLRINKRFRVLLAVIKRIAKVLNAKESNAEGSAAENIENAAPFIFGDVTAPSDVIDVVRDKTLSQSMDAIVDLNEFISNNDTAKRELSQRSFIFYDLLDKSKTTTSMQKKECSTQVSARKESPNKKQVSKRISLRVAMFKRQKSIQTQQFFESLRGSSTTFLPSDTLNLQITDILEQLGTTSIQADSN